MRGHYGWSWRGSSCHLPTRWWRTGRDRGCLALLAPRVPREDPGPEPEQMRHAIRLPGAQPAAGPRVGGADVERLCRSRCHGV
jgi:hypothetical protein